MVLLQRLRDAGEAPADPMDNVREYWETTGREQPWWGVLTRPEYADCDTLDGDAHSTFFASGLEDVAFFDRLLAQHCGLALADLGGGDCLELGCGVGRIAVHSAPGPPRPPLPIGPSRRLAHPLAPPAPAPQPLHAVAPRFRRIFCVDVARSYLERLRDETATRGLGNVVPVALESLEAVPRASLRLIYSLLTLQHNPPPQILRLVQQLCELLAPDGVALLHCPFAIDGHRPVVDAPVMQMHFVTQDALRAAVHSTGATVVAVDDSADRCGGGIKNCVYIVRR